jgi:DNA-binding transcriptional LysR family regulator
MEVRIEGNAALVEAIETEQLDVALVVGHADRPSAEVLGELDLVWIRGKQFSAPDREPLPLVLLGPQCAFRKQAIRSLDRAGIRWRIAAVSPSLAGIWASALGGLGVTARSALGLPAKLVSAAQMFNLPQLGSFPATLHMRQNDTSESSSRLRALIREAVARTLHP